MGMVGRLSAMSTETTPMTAAGLARLRDELDHLVNERRPIIVERIRVARELGDLKENAEYHDARNEQSMVETRIQVLEHRIRTAVISEAADASTVAIGTSVTVEAFGDREVWHIVGASEADPMENRISTESPIGKALLGASVGETVTATIPSGEMSMKVLEIALSA